MAFIRVEPQTLFDSIHRVTFAALYAFSIFSIKDLLSFELKNQQQMSQIFVDFFQILSMLKQKKHNTNNKI